MEAPVARHRPFGIAGGAGPGGAPRGAPCLFEAEADALTHARIRLDRPPEECVEVSDRDAGGRAVFRLRGGRMLALAEPPWLVWAKTRGGGPRRRPDGGRYQPKLSGSGMSLVASKAPEASVARVQGAAARCSPGDVSMEASA